MGRAPSRMPTCSGWHTRHWWKALLARCSLVFRDARLLNLQAHFGSVQRQRQHLRGAVAIRQVMRRKITWG